ncbi:alpha/beta hydrolase-fold protein, partial [Cesiribacter sp. SM1]|uniref:carboxylesterase family protein n=1 Tax=Cesiribacter sp. SM1 TaxID=2861196 RepID=UPI001CD42890
MRLPLIYLLTILCSLTALTVAAQEVPVYVPELYISKGDTLPYRILLPQNFDPEQQYPLVLFLHGSGERGNDNTAQLTHGSNLFFRTDIRNDFPAVVVFPQCPAESSWTSAVITNNGNNREFQFQTEGEPTAAMQLLQGLLHELRDRSYIDKQRLYVGGLSMGAMGTLELLRREPGKFAAAFAICGGDNPANARKYKNVPLWLFHGSKDDVVPHSFSTTLADKLEEIGARNIKLTIYPEVKHNSWDKALADPQLLPW